MMDMNNLISLKDLKKFASHLDQGIEYLENELRNPEKIIYENPHEKKDQAENKLESVAKEVTDLKNTIKTEMENFDSFSKECEKDGNDAELFFNEMYQGLKEIEALFEKHCYTPHKFCGIEDEKNLSSLSFNPSEQIENISPVLNSNMSTEEMYSVRRFSPSLNSTLLTSSDGNLTTDIFSSNWSSGQSDILKFRSNLMTPKTTSTLGASRNQLFVAPPDPGCSQLSLEVTGRSIRRLKYKF